MGILDTEMKAVILSEAEWKCLDMFLEELGGHQTNAGCNDLPKEMQALFTDSEGDELANELGEGPEWPLPDFCLLNLLQRKIKRQVNEV